MATAILPTLRLLRHGSRASQGPVPVAHHARECEKHRASWVTQGAKVAQAALEFGANDFGSTMIEENVVAAAGVTFRMTRQEIVNIIRDAGYTPAQRDTRYTILKVEN